MKIDSRTFRLVVCVMLGLVAGAALAADDDDAWGADPLTVPGPASGLGKPRAADLAPRLLGSEQFRWDGSPEQGIGWSGNVIEGIFVQDFIVNGTLTRVIVCAFSNLPAGTSAEVGAVVFADDGPGGGPGTLLAMSAATKIPGPATLDCSDITVPAVQRSGKTFAGIFWNANKYGNFFVGADNTASTPVREMYGRGRTGSAPPPFTLVRNNSPQIHALGIGVRVVSTGQALANCFDTGTVLCLNNGRFRVEVDWRRPNDTEGPAIDSALRRNDSGIVYFFDPNNLEMLIKVLNACNGAAGRYWVFAAATTNVEYTLTVTDTEAGKVKTYFNPLGMAAAPIQDTAAFATCP
jgi:hypothetical protein